VNVSLRRIAVIAAVAVPAAVFSGQGLALGKGGAPAVPAIPHVQDALPSASTDVVGPPGYPSIAASPSATPTGGGVPDFCTAFTDDGPFC
jgi:hypothetical protein